MDYYTHFTAKKDLFLVNTGVGLVIPKGIGTISLPIAYKGKTNYITLYNTLYIPDFPINIISGLRHYKSGGYITYTALYNAKKEPFATLNIAKRGFLLHIAGKPEPEIFTSAIRTNNSFNKAL